MRTCLILCVAALAAASPAAGYTLIDAWNPDGVPGAGIYGYPANFAIQYIPSESFTCARIEFWAAGSDYFADDQIVVRIEGDALDQPSGEVLAEVTTPVSDGDATWAGSDFPVPLTLEAGVTYWVVYLPMAWSQIAWANEGDELPTMGSGDGIHWNAAPSRRWMAKLWGDPIVATETATWSTIKSLFD
jgi:hypothetical protein